MERSEGTFLEERQGVKLNRVEWIDEEEEEGVAKWRRVTQEGGSGVSV